MALFLLEPRPTCEAKFGQLFGQRLIGFSPAVNLLSERAVRVKAKQYTVDVGRGVLTSLSKTVALSMLVATGNQDLLQRTVLEAWSSHVLSIIQAVSGKGVIHRNQAARRIKRLNGAVKALAAG